MDTIHRHFNVSIAEVGPECPHEVLTFAACCVARKKDQARKVLERVAEALSTYPEAEPLAKPEYSKR